MAACLPVLLLQLAMMPPRRSGIRFVLGSCTCTRIFRWPTLLHGHGRLFSAGFAITGDSIGPRFGKLYAHWITIWCVGHVANINVSAHIRCVLGIGFAGFS